ncbi:hypothetical protein TNCV_1360681 [Trichonephila clavipes]|nr:hypothetical protein TNCV_1360681 [Trichonephila clavipes]
MKLSRGVTHLSATPRRSDPSLETPWREDAEQLRYAPPHSSCSGSRRAASPLVELVEGEERWKAPDHPQGVLPLNWGGTEINRSFTCTVPKATVSDKLPYPIFMMNFVDLDLVFAISYTRAFGDGPRDFEPWSSDVDDTCAGNPSPSTGLEPVTKQATVRYLYHSVTAATRLVQKSHTKRNNAPPWSPIISATYFRKRRLLKSLCSSY